MLPWGRVVLESLHLTQGHHGVALTRHADGLEAAFHGHHHDDDATRHDHPLLGCDFSTQRSRVIEAIALPAALPAIVAMLVPSRAPAPALTRNAGVRDHGPPRALSPAILRI
jgi:hypothetical protein